jgi:hypothetical protein
MKALLFAPMLVAATCTSAFACTSEEAQEKATALVAKYQQFAVKNPMKAAEIGQRLTEAQMKYVTDTDGACSFYDEFSAEIDAAE